mmetsp:Transcript_112713/g.319268  ORF Transcript_112713/g.319268 Transcript_112713/m.319268 type:complete len:370 (-) Transcript_112713:365-1474(-)
MVPSFEEIRRLPKVELHAHLSGSITQQKLVEMLEKRGGGATFAPFDCREDVSNALVKCFDYFDKVAKVVADLETLKESTLHVLDTFAAENCLYLELRTSPKQFKTPAGESSKLQYLETVKAAIDEFHSYASERFGFVMEVRILLSVNRGTINSKEDALLQVDDILDMSNKFSDLVVGLDVGGNPSKPSVVPYLLPAMLERKQALSKLPVTFHTAEIKDDEESCAILNSMTELNIRRLGHCCFLPSGCRERLLAGGIHKDGGAIGIELCPTSNMVTRELPSLAGHHFPDWWRKSDGVLLSINTDDTGLFSCDLTSEVHDLAAAFGLTREDIVEIQRQAIRSSFHPDKGKLAQAFDAALLCGGQAAAGGGP